MLGLHYVPDGHVCPKRSAPWDLGLFSILLGIATFFNGLSRYAGRAVTGSGGRLPEAQRRGTARPPI